MRTELGYMRAICSSNGLFRLVTCIRTLERGGDHAVDICELTHFLVTGKFKEF